jgi:hypothetical protein
MVESNYCGFIKTNSRSNDFLHVAANDCDLNHYPQDESWNFFVLSVAHFSQVQAGDNSDSHRKSLHDKTEDR